MTATDTGDMQPDIRNRGWGRLMVPGGLLVGLAGCATAGLISSAFYGLIPAYAQTQGISSGAVSAYIATAIFGGLFFRIPAGKLSDKFDRRAVAVALAAGLSLCALFLSNVTLSAGVTFALPFVLGGFMSTIYPVCVAHENDRIEPEKVVSTSGQLILINGIASFFGAIIGTTIMGRVGVEGVYIYISVIAALFIVGTCWRICRVEGAINKERPFVILSERMGQPLAHIAEKIDAMRDEPSGQTSR